MEIVEKKPSELIPYANNSRTHSDDQVAQICASIREYGFTNPILIDEEGTIIAGHGRAKAAMRLGMESVPCIVLRGLTKAQKKAYVIADNKMALNAGWDEEKLRLELEGLKELDFDLSLTGFDEKELDGIFAKVGECEITEDDFDGEPPEDPKAKPGDVYRLGNHRLMCGDSTNPKDVEKLMGGAKADMVFTDPPYGMKKEKDGVLNDNLNYDDLLDFNRQWIPLTFGALKDNGSWYCWGIDEPLMDIYSNILKPMARENKITFRNLITWDKGNGQGQLSEDFRMYPIADEKCLFVMMGVQGFNNNQDNYFEGWEPVRQYLVGEAEKVGLTPQKLKEICGVGMWSHWFGKSQFAFITEEHYKELQDYYSKKEYDAFKKEYDAFKKEYDELKKEYDELKKEYYSTRAYFDNTHDNMNNVWHFDRAGKDEREHTGGHATPKPIALCSRAIKSSSREGEIVLDVFGGSGSTLIACEQSNRIAYLMELEPRWVDVIINRWEKLTGKKAELVEEGAEK